MLVGKTEINGAGQRLLDIGGARRRFRAEAAMPRNQTTLHFIIHRRASSVQVSGWLIGSLGPNIRPHRIHEIRRPGALANRAIVRKALGPIAGKVQLRAALERVEPAVDRVTSQPIDPAVTCPKPRMGSITSPERDPI